MLEIFTESSDFFTLKELEKIAPKKKGIISQSVKEVVQSLADDDMVFSDKCGVQTVFWCLPSDNVQKKRARLSHLSTLVVEKEKVFNDLVQEKATLKEGRQDTETRQILIAQVKEANDKKKKLQSKLQEFAECDPDFAEALKKGSRIAMEAANRWTDNLFVLRGWCENNFSMSRSDFDANFNVPADLDYLEISDKK